MELTVSDRRTDRRTDGRTDRRTDGRTDKVSYRGACYAPKNGAKPYHKYKTQKLTEDHKARRVVFAEWMLKKFGCARSNQPLGFLINTDFSAQSFQMSGLLRMFGA